MPPACLIAFDSAGFVPAAFQDQGIDCPASIARSVRKRQAEFFHGRLAARHAMAAQQIAPAAIAIGASREPLWPDGVIGSITHNNHIAAAVALRRGPWSGVGIDIETVVQADMQGALLTSVVTPAELAFLRALDTSLPFEMLLTMVFSAKESLFKGAFASVGSYFDFSAAEVCAVHHGPGPGYITLALTQTLSRDFIRSTEHRVYFDFPQADAVLTCYAW
ncbi:4'-phosphopantetheinyl transferase superfamily protein [Oxalobacteraceae bacterium]|nr:4'-phosphopantetheinyl transferase superfamily protein [Oxalobacteraceae bacterium]